MDISISTTIFGPEKPGNIPLKKGLEMLKEAGYSQIEFSRKHKKLSSYKTYLDELGLTVWAIHGTLGSGALSFSETERQQTLANEIRSMEDVSCYGKKPYVIHYLFRHNDPEIGGQWQKSVEELHEKAQELNIILTIETVPYKPEVNERYAGSIEVSDFVRSFNSPFLKTCVDLNHSNLNEDLVEVIHNCHGLIANIHVSDNHGHREEHLLLGEGIIDFRQAFAALEEAGYTGPCNLECHTDEKPTVERLRELRLNTEKIIHP